MSKDMCFLKAGKFVKPTHSSVSWVFSWESEGFVYTSQSWPLGLRNRSREILDAVVSKCRSGFRYTHHWFSSKLPMRARYFAPAHDLGGSYCCWCSGSEVSGSHVVGGAEKQFLASGRHFPGGGERSSRNLSSAPRARRRTPGRPRWNELTCLRELGLIESLPTRAGQISQSW